MTYVHSRQDGQDVFESYKSIAKDGGLTPLTSTHVSNNEGTPREITTQFSGNNGRVAFRALPSRNPYQTATLVRSKTAGYSAFLYYALDLKRLKPKIEYIYDTLAEERGRLVTGALSLAAQNTVGRIRINHLVDDYMGQRIESFINDNGEPLGSRSLASNRVAYWVPSKEQAVGNLDFPTHDCVVLFGDLPVGKKNAWSKISGFDAAKVIKSFPRSEGVRKLSAVPDTRKMLPLPRRAR